MLLTTLTTGAAAQNLNTRGDGPLPEPEAAQVWEAVQPIPFAAEGSGTTLYVLVYSTCPYAAAFYNDWHGRLNGVQVRWVLYPTSSPASQDASGYAAMTHDASAVDRIFEHRFVPPPVRSSPQLVAAHDKVSATMIQLNQLFEKYGHAQVMSPTFIWHHGNQLMVSRGYDKAVFAQLLLPSIVVQASGAETAGLHEPASAQLRVHPGDQTAGVAAGQTPNWKIHPTTKARSGH